MTGEVHFSRRRVWCIWPSLLQEYKYGGGFLMSLLSLCLNVEKHVEGEFFLSSDSPFEARITEGRIELHYCCDKAGIVVV